LLQVFLGTRRTVCAAGEVPKSLKQKVLDRIKFIPLVLCPFTGFPRPANEHAFWPGCVLLIAPVLSSAQSIPAVKAKALDNSEITLPNPGSQQV
jgi:hypothetical protein